MPFFGCRIIQNVINLIRFGEKAEDRSMSGAPSVMCPSCARALYRVVMVSRGLNALSDDSPKIQSDVNGYFMVCLHCRERIALKRDRSAPSGIGYQVDSGCGGG